MDKYTYIANSDAAYIDELYNSYKQDPASVDEGWQKFFEGYDFYQKFPATGNGHTNGAANGKEAAVVGKTDPARIRKEMEVVHLIRGYRSRGHLLATTNPIQKRKDRRPQLDIADFNLGPEDLDTVFEAGVEVFDRPATLREIVDALQTIYARNIGFEYLYIRDREQKSWLRKKIEKEALTMTFSIDEKKHILSKLNEAVVFENFLHTKYLGQKRFSLEGGETTIPALDAMINKAAEMGVVEVMIGMAHRGRLNVLANIMQKTYGQIFNEFEGNLPDQVWGDGDVKYHMGFASQITTKDGNHVHLKLAPNPSHLEAVNPVVEGYIRARADGMYDSDYDRVLPVLIHGDAAVAGQGIVYEVTQMSALNGYYTGGTIHFVINNQVGFTTDFTDARSSIYCTDIAKIVDAPVLHVNGDDPEAVVYCMRLAVEYRQKFNKDIFIDMVCYRRHGHNEADEPKFTQPVLYKSIENHQNPREIYQKTLAERGDVDAQLAANMDKEFKQLLQERLDMVKQKALPYTMPKLEQEWHTLRKSKPEDFEKSPETGVPLEVLEKIGKALITTPESFNRLKQIDKLLKDREQMIFDKKEVNWATAELLAYGSILTEGNIVRLSGQDVQRGTFSHRHAVLRDVETNASYNSLQHIQDGQGQFMIYNSLLSEYGVLGFEFGYSMANPNALVIWEAQFGDFANGTQVIIDQFVTSSETKWDRWTGLVMLLPHGYEGQGPEHSNARPERYLQLSANYNIIVANVTTPANFFHLLRRQLKFPFRKPLIVMSPKSMLRHPLCVSPIDSLVSGSFQETIGDTYADPKKVKKVLLCTGKLYYELYERQQADKRDDVAIIRLEQMHPFPQTQIDAHLAQYENANVFWVQEEPFNMGGWTFMLRMYKGVKPLQVIAREPSASPSTGFSKIHTKEQAEIINRAFE
ncbi:2-oxoglutarate dehydrogenase E1 component [Dyadobacter sp. BE34]|uniref:oxoglutarate dehydrogenase (succinyl-transferring) n=1 Tax=Dyadobacter fermentans TaxID=94254 RepID=A0ABU1R6S4_9BACT|nr:MULTISPECIES: 2-oxoglutarate dehydrogenase E1 component [Dyadobacter]MDR6809104.1 2-oxoglutarate dehydrogenase E1 component [Dyadobacter fermentans]MDR7046847.1 2-oxoglutarate dehydrogenase E1 component [Dyadobacter sp. BE242]MDR7201161.1 2-oxoglutarate dehydrogenase E1 component [Dyadobacter sp. BE34]MDR7219121.1 2-oxoglutarate dehydrogenase E1 component [Dyadobacter sp. BE31]MDR7264669.1 2-oxoglutarate dehydrogenase E1 component [Dyadobacter sp. BE32]